MEVPIKFVAIIKNGLVFQGFIFNFFIQYFISKEKPSLNIVNPQEIQENAKHIISSLNLPYFILLRGSCQIYKHCFPLSILSDNNNKISLHDSFKWLKWRHKESVFIRIKDFKIIWCES